MVGRVINGAGSIFEADILIPLSHSATPAAENEAEPITQKPLGLETF